jgi:hypothetical protein
VPSARDARSRAEKAAEEKRAHKHGQPASQTNAQSTDRRTGRHRARKVGAGEGGERRERGWTRRGDRPLALDAGGARRQGRESISSLRADAARRADVLDAGGARQEGRRRDLGRRQRLEPREAALGRGGAASKASGSPRRCTLARAFPREYSYKGQLGSFVLQLPFVRMMHIKSSSASPSSAQRAVGPTSGPTWHLSQDRPDWFALMCSADRTGDPGGMASPSIIGWTRAASMERALLPWLATLLALQRKARPSRRGKNVAEWRRPPGPGGRPPARARRAPSACSPSARAGTGSAWARTDRQGR